MALAGILIGGVGGYSWAATPNQPTPTSCPAKGTQQMSTPDPTLSELCPDQSERLLACGPASMAIALKLLGKPIVNEELVALADETGDTNYAIMADYARRQGLNARAAKLPPETLIDLTGVAILQVLTPMPIDSKRPNHFAVFAGASGQEAVYLFDPVAAHGTRGRIPVSELAEFYTGKALVISNQEIKLPFEVQAAMAGSSGTTPLGMWLLIGAGLVSMACGGVLAVVRRRRGPEAALAMKCLLLAALVSVGMAPEKASAKGKSSGPGCSTCGRSATTRPATPEVNESPYVVGPLQFYAGEVHRGEYMTCEYPIQNPTEKPIDIKLGHRSCACLDPQILGPTHIGPGESSIVRVVVHASSTGGITQGVMLHVSGEEQPIPLTVAAVVRGDTQLTPKKVDFGEASRVAEPMVRKVRVEHWPQADQTLVIEDITFACPFMRAGKAGPPKKYVGHMPDDRMLLEFEVTFDPKLAPVGRFAEIAEVRGKAGTADVTFKVLCAGTILPPVVARPSRIVRMEKRLPETIEARMRLQASVKEQRVVVADVSGQGIEILNWTQSAPGAADETEVTLSMKADPAQERVKATCRVQLSEPAGESIEVPILLIETERTKTHVTKADG